jgi:hypothetical protein
MSLLTLKGNKKYLYLYIINVFISYSVYLFSVALYKLPFYIKICCSIKKKNNIPSDSKVKNINEFVI